MHAIYEEFLAGEDWFSTFKEKITDLPCEDSYQFYIDFFTYVVKKDASLSLIKDLIEYNEDYSQDCKEYVDWMEIISRYGSDKFVKFLCRFEGEDYDFVFHILTDAYSEGYLRLMHVFTLLSLYLRRSPHALVQDYIYSLDTESFRFDEDYQKLILELIEKYNLKPSSFDTANGGEVYHWLKRLQEEEGV